MLFIQKTFKNNLPTIYMVGTPIGNLEDMSQRAIDTLKHVDVILCEDTRTSKALLNKYHIDKPLMSLHKFNESDRADEIIDLINQHKNMAIISDAGVPAISDPGANLINILRWHYNVSFNVSAVNAGPAYIHSIAMSGFNNKTNFFYGFIENKGSESKTNEVRQVLKNNPNSIVSFYESVHRIQDTIKTLNSVLDKKTLITVNRELTKLNEEVIYGTIDEVDEFIQSDEFIQKGEFVIVIQNNIVMDEITDESLMTIVDEEIKKGKRIKEISAEMSKEYNVNKNYIYDLYIKNKSN